MSKIEVLHLIDHAGIGGVNPLLENLSRHGSNRFGLHVAALGPSGPLADRLASGTQFLALGATSRRHYREAIGMLVRYLRERRVRLVQTHLFESSLVGVAAARLAGIPSVVTAHHSIELLRTPSRLWRTAERLNLRWLANFLSAPSTRVAATLTTAYSLPPGKVAVVPYWFDLAKWPAARIQRQALRAELKLGDALVLVAAGRYSWIKNYPMMLRALAASRHRERALLLIAGQGPDQAAVARLVRELDLERNVRMLGLWTDMPGLFAAADYFVHASDAECFSQAAVEAAASGLPLLCTDVGGAHELVEASGGGLLSPPGDLPAFTAMLDEALAWTEAERQARGVAAQQASRYYNLEDGVSRQETQVLRWIA